MLTTKYIWKSIQITDKHLLLAVDTYQLKCVSGRGLEMLSLSHDKGLGSRVGKVGMTVNASTLILGQ